MEAQVNTQHCPYCSGQGILLVDIETETIPQVDAQGNLQYHCMLCQRTFSVEQDREVPLQEKRSSL